MAWFRRLILFILLAAAPVAWGQSAIELRQQASLSSGSPVRIGDVAALAGGEAEALAEVIIRETWRSGERITVDDVRRAADRSARIHWGRISLRGSTCMLGEVSQAAPAPAPPVVEAPVETEGTVRASVLARIMTVAHAPLEDLRVSFASDDADLLNLPSAGKTIEVTPTGMSDHLPLAIRIFEGDRLAQSRTIRVAVEVRRPVVIAGVSRRRGETIAGPDVTPGVQWLGLTARPASMDQVVGASPRMRLSAGQVVMLDDVTAPIVVNKGDQVMVYCVNGTFVVTTRARAMAAGRDGELVLFQALDSRRTFLARMDGRGRAVINMAGGGES